MNQAPILQFSALSLPAMESLARKLGPMLCPGDTVTLSGEVGCGKTTFARALIGALVPGACEVTSPTFPLSQSYDMRLADGKPETLWHLDLYRLKTAQEADALGLRELWQHIVLIEWPALIERLLPAQRLDVAFGFPGSQAARSLHFHGNDAWRERLGRLK